MAKKIDCPSAQADSAAARIYGVMTPTEGGLRAGFLTETLAPTPEWLALAGTAKPSELFRIAAPCSKKACGHFSGGACTLAQRVVAGLKPVVDALPACQIRDTCRWFFQEGREACLRCPQVQTDSRDASEAYVEIARLPDRA